MPARIAFGEVAKPTLKLLAQVAVTATVAAGWRRTSRCSPSSIMCTFVVMRTLITGLDAAGRSCIAEESKVVPAPVDGFAGLRTAALFHTQQSPPPPRPPALAHTVDVQLPPGLIRWMIVEHEPSRIGRPNRDRAGPRRAHRGDAATRWSLGHGNRRHRWSAHSAAEHASAGASSMPALGKLTPVEYELAFASEEALAA
jgi:hypothetical protein